MKVVHVRILRFLHGSFFMSIHTQYTSFMLCLWLSYNHYYRIEVSRKRGRET